MQQTLDAQAQVQDDLPTLRSELVCWWQNHVQPLIDFRSFLRQRRAILNDHELARSSLPPYDGWKNPFAFALTASTLTFTVVALLGIVFHTFFPDPDLKHDWIAHSLQAQLNADNAKLRSMAPSDKIYAGFVAERDRLATDMADHISGLTVPHEGILLTAGVPLVVYFLGVFFPRFVQKKVPGAPHASASREIAYYYFTAKTFWPGFLLVTGGAMYFFLLKYSLLSTYDEIPQTFPVNSGPLYVLLVFMAIIGAAPFLYASIATPIAFHKCAKEISAVLGVVDAHAKRVIYWGLIRTILIASCLALFLTVLLASTYTLLDTGSQSLRTSIGTSLSTTPTDQHQ